MVPAFAVIAAGYALAGTSTTFELMVANFAISFLLFRNPVGPDPGKSVSGVLAGAAMVLRDHRFMILLVIYSGFWFMYAVNNAAITLFMVDFRVWDVAPAMVAVVNPVTILAAGPFLGKLVERFDSLHAMIGGMVIFIGGLLIMGLPGTWPFFVAGIVIFSIAGFIVHPTYISYVSKIAPRDKVPVYMGYSFMPALIGYASGNFLVALAYTIFAEGAHRPGFFWAIVASVGLLTIACLMLYSLYLGRHKAGGAWNEAEAVSASREAGAAAESDRVAPVPVEARIRRHPAWESPLSADGYLNANTDTTERVRIDDRNLLNVTFTLTWTDEPDRLHRRRERLDAGCGILILSKGLRPFNNL
ncbi:MAG: MFS transporter [Euryarchaeota archaeon]|nr:MFS transporter [Euryarchaeota archaeon]